MLGLRAGEKLAWHVDDQVEDVHFRRKWASFSDIGWKAAAAALSDLAAVGARPLGVQLALELPRDVGDRSVLELVDGFLELLAAEKAPLVGGNVAARPAGTGLSLSVSVAGAVRSPLRRDTARAGDRLWVSGSPGMARLGLLLLERGKRSPRAPIERLLRPRPLLALGQALGRLRRGRPRAGMDVSDGLARSAEQLARASGLRAVLLEDSLPVAALRRFVAAEEARRLVLEGGEDYELFLAAPGELARTAPGRSFHEIGFLERGSGAVLRTASGSDRGLRDLGFRHR